MDLVLDIVLLQHQTGQVQTFLPIMVQLFLLQVVAVEQVIMKYLKVLEEQVVEPQVNKVDMAVKQEVEVDLVVDNLEEDHIQVKLVEEHALVEHLYVVEQH